MDSVLRGHSACSEFCGSASAHSLHRMSNTTHSLASHNPQNSSTILECQQDSALGSHLSDFENNLSVRKNTQTQVAMQRENPKRSEIIAPRLPKRKSGGFCLFGAGGLGGNPFSFCDEKPKEFKTLEVKPK